MVTPTTTPINNLFNQLKNCMKFATNDLDPITEATAIKTGVLIIEGNCSPYCM